MNSLLNLKPLQDGSCTPAVVSRPLPLLPDGRIVASVSLLSS